MLRLTNKKYLEQWEFLRLDWFERRVLEFSQLSYAEQMVLHHFYTSCKELTAKQALAHRREMQR